MIHKENTCPTFKHPENWPQMPDLEKGHLVVKVIFLKLLAVVDFCDFEFKEASSLFREIEEFLNVDFRLACNKPKLPSRDIEKVREEIMSTAKGLTSIKIIPLMTCHLMIICLSFLA